MNELYTNVWKELIGNLSSRKRFGTLKGKATAIIERILDDKINIKLDNGNIREIKKDHVFLALKNLEKDQNHRIRQLKVAGDVERYLLGALIELPQFEKVKEFDESEGKIKTFVKLK